MGGEQTASDRWVRPLPWLSRSAIAAVALLMCLPFALVEIPPLVDMPGHIGAVAIEAAPVDSPLWRSFRWEWAFNLNMGGELLMKVLAPLVGFVGAGWWASVIATALLAFGLLLTVRALNPRGAFGLGWALAFVFAFPWVWGFLNFLLAAGVALLVFGGSVGLRHRPAARCAMLIGGQVVALMCHAVGGMLLFLLVTTEAIGDVLDNRAGRASGHAAHQAEGGAIGPDLRRLVRDLWPLFATPVILIAWRAFGPQAAVPQIDWHFEGKVAFMLGVLRDQSQAVDMANVIGAFLVLLIGWLSGARYGWRKGLPVVMMIALYALAPTKINGSEFVDMRLLPITMMLTLGLQDWSSAKPQLRGTVAAMGAIFLAIRLALIAHGFHGYDRDFRRQLGAIEHISEGARVFVLQETTCGWRHKRLDTLASLAALYRGAWTNTHWTTPGLHMVRAAVDVTGPSIIWSSMVRNPQCAFGYYAPLDAVFPAIPVERLDYVWLIDTGIPSQVSPRLKSVWQSDRSLLYKVQPPD